MENAAKNTNNGNNKPLTNTYSNIRHSVSSIKNTGNTKSDKTVYNIKANTGIARVSVQNSQSGQQLQKINTNVINTRIQNKNNVVGNNNQNDQAKRPQLNNNLTRNDVQNQLYQLLKNLSKNSPPIRTQKKTPHNIQQNPTVKNNVMKEPTKKEVQAVSPNNKLICDCITNQCLIELEYDGGKRKAEIYCYGINEAGNEAIRVYQISGYSSSGNSTGYKMFLVGDIRNIIPLTNEKFNKRPDYKINDSSFVTFFCQVR